MPLEGGDLTVGRRLVLALMTPLTLVAFAVTWFMCALDRGFGFPMPFPRSLAELRAQQDWCVAKLQAAGVVPAEAEITGYEVVPMQAAFRSRIGRVTVRWRLEQRTGELSCVAKLDPSAGTSVNRAVYVLQRNHVNEVNSYVQLGLGPECYYGRCGRASGRMLLLLADHSNDRQHDERAGCPLEDARQAVTALAELHREHWGMKARAWPTGIPPAAVDFFTMFATGKERAAARRLCRATWRQCNRPQTLLHGDARVGNIFFARSALLFDWQATRLGLAAFDVAYFLTLSLTTQDLLRHEAELVDLYHATLTADGVDYPREMLNTDLLDALMLVAGLLFLPFLSGEISVDDETREDVVEGGVVWTRRFVARAARVPDAALQARYGITHEALMEILRQSLTKPPALNPGAWFVADEVQKLGGADAFIADAVASCRSAEAAG